MSGTSVNQQINGSFAERRLKILLVEDDPHWQYLIGRALESAVRKSEVSCADLAELAGGLLDREADSYDLVIADHFEQESSTGRDLWLKCQEIYSNIPFLMISGLRDSEFLDIAGSDLNLLVTWQLAFPPGKISKLKDKTKNFKKFIFFLIAAALAALLVSLLIIEALDFSVPVAQIPAPIKRATAGP